MKSNLRALVRFRIVGIVVSINSRLWLPTKTLVKNLSDEHFFMELSSFSLRNVWLWRFFCHYDFENLYCEHRFWEYSLPNEVFHGKSSSEIGMKKTKGFNKNDLILPEASTVFVLFARYSRHSAGSVSTVSSIVIFYFRWAEKLIKKKKVFYFSRKTFSENRKSSRLFSSFMFFVFWIEVIDSAMFNFDFLCWWNRLSEKETEHTFFFFSETKTENLILRFEKAFLVEEIFGVLYVEDMLRCLFRLVRSPANRIFHRKSYRKNSNRNLFFKKKLVLLALSVHFLFVQSLLRCEYRVWFSPATLVSHRKSVFIFKVKPNKGAV